ncbi:MAG: hypothetical protein J7L43_01145 [Candidatus Aenigmarchaeota archaeon]|nr:hypothetical protein [Candidatus Aenigmarchaeota archaeon]
MELPTWFLVFMTLGVIVLGLIILVVIKPSLNSIHQTNSTTTKVIACTEWSKNGCSSSTDKISALGGAEINDILGCSDDDSCRKECQKYGLCTG